MNPAPSASLSPTRRRFLAQAGSFLTAALGSRLAAPLLAAEQRGARSPGDVPVMGIVEWYCAYLNYGVMPPDDGVIEDCVAVHQAAGINHIVWAVGRAAIEYHSADPRNTLMGELGTRRLQSTPAGEDPAIWEKVGGLLRRECLVRRAIAVCRERKVTSWGRLGMNRHYGTPQTLHVTSKFSRDNPGYRELSRSGNVDGGRLCFAIKAVQAERLRILTEVQSLGFEGLVLDYCRQPPIARYHPEWTEAFRKQNGSDPRSLAAALDARLPWFQFRADALTEFMREVRVQMRKQEGTLGRPCQLIARIPATSLVSNLAAGLDVARWLKEDLIDGVMLSPLVFCLEAKELDFAGYVALAHRAGKTCIGGLGSLDVMQNHVPRNTGFFAPGPMYQMVHRQYEAGVDAMSVYQTESSLRMDYLQEHLLRVRNRAAVAGRAAPMPGSLVGYDWHSAGHSKGTFKGYSLTGTGGEPL